MDTNNPIIKLCIAGTQAEFNGNMEAACELYRQAWATSMDDYEACIAAHYLARCQKAPEDIFHWNQIALERARTAEHERVEDFYPSLYLNMGRSYESLGNQAEAEKYYSQAAELGVNHQLE
jgi:tetratricopeptide (TPR) repeat protein